MAAYIIMGAMQLGRFVVGDNIGKLMPSGFSWFYVLVCLVSDSVNIQKTIDRYQRYTKDEKVNSNPTEENVQHLKYETANMTKKIEHLEAYKRKLTGEDLESCSTDELHQMEKQLERSLSSIRQQKNQLFKEKIEQLKQKEKFLLEEKAMLYEKCGIPPEQQTKQPLEIMPLISQNSQNSEVENEIVPSCREEDSEEDTEVETELFIGWSGRGRTHQSSKKAS
ncbi:hypothetical protein GIB67_019168 [Kingdonia uniflora]|uniref:K-box domain-containing protein n=1 Tax=Kingdonia uniflora TaxID=39325 RepID=A0A7J7MZL7_9MAGN|nr:hypothetical protein GIB67_019168 [Kingdonia uniflora]